MSVLDRKKCDDMVNAGGGIGVLERAQPRGQAHWGSRLTVHLMAPVPLDHLILLSLIPTLLL